MGKHSASGNVRVISADQAAYASARAMLDFEDLHFKFTGHPVPQKNLDDWWPLADSATILQVAETDYSLVHMSDEKFASLAQQLRDEA